MQLFNKCLSFLPLPPASHLLEINIEFSCRKVVVDKAVNGWEKPGRALQVSSLAFLCRHKCSLPHARSSLCTHRFLGIVSIVSSPSAPREVPACPRLPSDVQFGFTAIPQPVTANSPIGASTGPGPCGFQSKAPTEAWYL